MKAREVLEGCIRAELPGIKRRHTVERLAGSFLNSLDAAGFVILPKEPTEGMIEAALDDYATNSPFETPHGPNGSFASEYRAMRDAYLKGEGE
jgi:hypothetical protein